MGQSIKVVVENGGLRPLEPIDLADGEVLEIAFLTPTPAAPRHLNGGAQLTRSGDPASGAGRSSETSGAEERARTFEADLRSMQEAFAELPFEVRRELVEQWEGPEAAASYKDSAA